MKKNLLLLILLALCTQAFSYSNNTYNSIRKPNTKSGKLIRKKKIASAKPTDKVQEWCAVYGLKKEFRCDDGSIIYQCDLSSPKLICFWLPCKNTTLPQGHCGNGQIKDNIQTFSTDLEVPSGMSFWANEEEGVLKVHFVNNVFLDCVSGTDGHVVQLVIQ